MPSSWYDSFRDGHCKLKRKYGKERDGDDSTDLFRLLRYGRRKGEEDTPLTVGIAFSLDRCLLMGDPTSPFWFGLLFLVVCVELLDLVKCGDEFLGLVLRNLLEF